MRTPRHLYVVRIDPERAGATRDVYQRALADELIATSIHFLPVHRLRWFRERYPTREAPGRRARRRRGALATTFACALRRRHSRRVDRSRHCTRVSRLDRFERGSPVLVLTLLVRDEADIVDACVAFHLNAGADFVIATDHRSEDGSRELLERYERLGVLRLIREDRDEFDSQAVRTRMARLAAEEYGADWVIGADADEFFWPRGGSLAEVLAAIPRRFGVVNAPWRPFVPRPDGDDFFAERMTARLSPAVAHTHPHGRYKPEVKIAHRGDPHVVVQGGNHRLLGSDSEPMPGWHPIEVLHFPSRSVKQLERKMAHWARAGRDWRFEQAAVSDAHGWFDALAVDADVLAAGVAAAALVVDTRLRDALRLIRRTAGDGPPFLLPPESPELSFAAVSEDDASFYRGVIAALDDRILYRLQRRVDELGARAASLEAPGNRPQPVG